ncbi:protein-L-isoaspartate O-methyltransferase [Georgenia sp. SYP-B2076]|uniref:protein-L-isoaspartate O-methyltransferase family protein n=1 Tax=Georgenia sp. SYP-B2076 TaxID=2495881 RepID=UPI000F8EBCF7|nr:methyltransferase domain-containing protein [Georgenia sp. SYP-B2076]
MGPGRRLRRTSDAARVIEAMTAVDRLGFLPPDQHRFARADLALRIGSGATCSQPSTVERMLHLLGARPGDRVLDVGSGSGWTTALLARLVAPGGWVVGVEIEPDLVEVGRANLLAAGCSSARLEQAVPGHVGRPEEAPYDRILVSAEARSTPSALTDQLADGGRLVIPVRGVLHVIDRAGGELRDRSVAGTYQFVPLRAADD